MDESKPETAVLEARISANHLGIAHTEMMALTKVGAESIVRNAAAGPAAFTNCWLGPLSLLLGRSSLDMALLP